MFKYRVVIMDDEKPIVEGLQAFIDWEEEGFTIGGKSPTQCRCDAVMIVHPDYTINYVVGSVTTMHYHSNQSVKVKYD